MGKDGRDLSARLLARWVALALLFLVFASSADRASSGPIEGQLLKAQSVASPTLGRPIPYVVYVPAAAAADPNRRFPVLYLLHGKGDDETAWMNFGDVGATLDRKIAVGDIQPMIVVMPSARNSWYVDDTRPDAFGRYATAFVQDLLPGVEHRHPASTCAGGRAMGGLSMGGYGAVLHAVSRPDLFAAAFSLSGSLFSEQAADIEARKTAYGRIFGGVFGEPFETARFLDWNVFMRLDKRADEINRLAFWLAAGDDDFASILGGTVRFHQELRRRGIASELRVMDGGHEWALWSRALDPALSWLSPRLKPDC